MKQSRAVLETMSNVRSKRLQMRGSKIERQQGREEPRYSTAKEMGTTQRAERERSERQQRVCVLDGQYTMVIHTQE